MSVEQLRSALLTTGDEIPSLDGKTVTGRRLNLNNAVSASYRSIDKGPAQRIISMELPTGRYQFKVMASNSVGASSWSAASNVVTAR